MHRIMEEGIHLLSKRKRDSRLKTISQPLKIKSSLTSLSIDIVSKHSCFNELWTTSTTPHRIVRKNVAVAVQIQFLPLSWTTKALPWSHLIPISQLLLMIENLTEEALTISVMDPVTKEATILVQVIKNLEKRLCASSPSNTDHILRIWSSSMHKMVKL